MCAHASEIELNFPQAYIGFSLASERAVFQFYSSNDAFRGFCCFYWGVFPNVLAFLVLRRVRIPPSPPISLNSRLARLPATPVPIREFLIGHTIRTAAQQQWEKLKNGDLLTAAEHAGFEVFLTTDKNLQSQ